MSVKIDHTNSIPAKNEAASCKISDLKKACDCLDKLQIAIYLIDENKFIYANNALEKIIGVSKKTLLNKSWCSWYTLIRNNELVSVKSQISTFLSTMSFQDPFLLRYHIKNEKGDEVYLRHEIVLHKLEAQILVINYFYDLTEKEKIETYFLSFGKKNTDFSEYTMTPISPREKEVLKLVADGFSSKQIAARLFISSHTAITHRKNLIEKFKVKNTAQLIKRASRNKELW